MCAACGVLNGGADWLERAGNPDGIGADENATRRAERQNLINMVNVLLAPSRPNYAILIQSLLLKVLRGRRRSWMTWRTCG